MIDTLDLRPPQRSTRGMIGVPTTLTASLLDADGEPKEAEAVDLYIGGPTSASWPLPDPLGDVTKITGTLDEETGLWMLAVPGLPAGMVLLRLVVDGALVGRLLHHVGSEGSTSPTTELVVRDGAGLVLHLTAIGSGDGGGGGTVDSVAREAIEDHEALTTGAHNLAALLDGKADLDGGGKVPAAQLPSYVDDVIEVDEYDDLPAVGETGKVYVDLATNLTYRWSGSAYVRLDEGVALGETSSTAYRGDRGKEAWDHAGTTGNPHGTEIGEIPGLADALAPIDLLYGGTLRALAVGQEALPVARNGFPFTDRWWVDGPTPTAVEHADRVAADLDYWPDGNIGFATISGTTYGFAANGDKSSRWTATEGDLLGAVHETALPLTTIEDADYASGGPIFQADGKLFKVWHGERHGTIAGQPDSFVSFLGLAWAPESDPDDWTDLGRIITPGVGVDAPVWADIGGGACTVLGDWVYVFFSDTLLSPWVTEDSPHIDASVVRVPIAVARASLADIVAWAGGGPPAQFTKFHVDGWDEPGIDGDSSSLIPGVPWPSWMDVITLTDHEDRIALVWTGKLDAWGPEANDWHGVWCSISAPGNPEWWEPPRTLVEPQRKFMAYPTLVAPGLVSANEVAGSTVHLYTVESFGAADGEFRWDDATVTRRTLRHLWKPGVGEWVYPTLLNGWTDLFGSPPRYRRVGERTLEIQIPGIGGGSAAAVFQIPGIQMATHQAFPVLGIDGVGDPGLAILTVNAAGVVEVYVSTPSVVGVLGAISVTAA